MTAPGVPSLADQLVNLAARLLDDEIGKRDQAVMRRAISTAYYAVFHRLCELCADALGKSESPRAYVAIYRLLDHGPVKNTLSQMKDLEKDLSWTVSQFQELQDARHWADYDPAPGRATDEGRSFPLEKARELVEFARHAVATLDALDPEKQLSLALQLVGKSRRKLP
jgi:uncharacterized protein (UPF0332 family)